MCLGRHGGTRAYDLGVTVGCRNGIVAFPMVRSSSLRSSRTFVSAETEDMEHLFVLVLIAAWKLCSRDDRKRLNVLDWTSVLMGGLGTLEEVDTELTLGSGSWAMLKGLEIPSCVWRAENTSDESPVDVPQH